ncbi:MAG: L-seryl-tRNA(Sec) selenium transferase, partial [Burkholderiales bacterium]|nr:L-seryl-tRNA(Sec) selenium transferase [Burkholderiales bacterium]
TVTIVVRESQIGSGALPLSLIASHGLAIGAATGKLSGTELENLASRFRGLAIPIIGRVQEGRLLFDLRTLEDEAGLIDQLRE